MSLKNRLHRIEKLNHLHGTSKQRPATIERTASGEYYLLSPDDRVLIGDEGAFEKWKPAGNRAWAIVENLTPRGSEMVRRIINGERTRRTD